MTDLSRRSFLKLFSAGAAGALAAPLILKDGIARGIIMPVKPLAPQNLVLSLEDFLQGEVDPAMERLCNRLLTEEKIVKEALAILHDNLVWSSKTNRKYEDLFIHNKNRINIRMPR